MRAPVRVCVENAQQALTRWARISERWLLSPFHVPSLFVKDSNKVPIAVGEKGNVRGGTNFVSEQECDGFRWRWLGDRNARERGSEREQAAEGRAGRRGEPYTAWPSARDDTLSWQPYSSHNLQPRQGKNHGRHPRRYMRVRPERTSSPGHIGGAEALKTILSPPPSRLSVRHPYGCARGPDATAAPTRVFRARGARTTTTEEACSRARVKQRTPAA